MRAEEFLPTYPDCTKARTDAERFAKGLAIMRSVDPAMVDEIHSGLADTAPDMAQNIVAHCFGEIYARPALDPRDRQLATVAMLIALGATDPQLGMHVRAAVKVGISREQLLELLMHATIYCGYLRALNALAVVSRVTSDVDSK